MRIMLAPERQGKRFDSYRPQGLYDKASHPHLKKQKLIENIAKILSSHQLNNRKNWTAG